MITTTTSGAPAMWRRRWDRQQAAYVPDRGTVVDLMLEIVDRLGATPGALVDLGCGPGTLACRAAERWPQAHVLGIDLDPVLLALGRETSSRAITWVEDDLRDARALDHLASAADGPLDAAVSATALHWLTPAELHRLVAGLAATLRPGAVFVNYDTLPLDAATPRLRALAEEHRQALAAGALASSGADDWAGWWEGLRAAQLYPAEFTERERRFGARAADHRGATLGEFTAALRGAGFAEVAVMRQVADRHLLVAIR
ncbi:trans-aconitate 2-methyltransferase [Pseudonocardia sp. MH-G8]|uniref:class I SAM-dependent methyltransferase n=1 Tax=Pseudonocardia sp. MH-G8 TaxID=1854588 RepID=UPI000B9FAA22|nr:class I SAM-dependent methyltransferase [Pseudonocardia sp. MH-G8]OZM78135.1 SAM-dependent methyltransferase [Pseudonocardia sp. MH-G8]